MTTIKINKSIKLQTLDKKDMNYICGEILQSNFQMGIQPKSIAYIEQSPNYNKGNNITLEERSLPIYMLEIQDKDPWELYGSDHNSGVLWFGDNEKMDKIHQEYDLDAGMNIKNKPRI